MSYLSELTAHERLTVDNATLDMFTAFENGSDLIYDIWEQYFLIGSEKISNRET